MHYLICILSLSLIMQTTDAKIVGGWSAKSHEEAHEAVNESMNAMNQLNSITLNEEASASFARLDIAKPVSLVETLQVQTQVVAGINYKLHLKVLSGSGSTHDIEVIIWSRPWLTSSDQWTITSISPLKL